MKQMDGRFILLHKPEKDFVGWYQGVQKDYGLTPYMTIEKPDPYLMQNRYQGDNKEEMFFSVMHIVIIRIRPVFPSATRL